MQMILCLDVPASPRLQWFLCTQQWSQQWSHENSMTWPTTQVFLYHFLLFMNSYLTWFDMILIIISIYICIIYTLYYVYTYIYIMCIYILCINIYIYILCINMCMYIYIYTIYRNGNNVTARLCLWDPSWQLGVRHRPVTTLWPGFSKMG
jgi:hypothetical protein